MHTQAWESEVDVKTRAAFDALLSALRKHDISLVARADHPEFAALEDAFFGAFIDHCVAITSYEMKWPYEQYFARYPDLLEQRHRDRVVQARAMTPDHYAELLSEKAAMKDRTRKAMEGADAILTLSSSGPAPVGHSHTGSRAYLLFASFLQLPAFSLPLMEADGMPVGAQLIGHAGRDGELCAVANWMSRSLAAE
jgi:Asp-tRNA(Asn)/Glu-tRNA(Gln) amidotransferase A subunit family amidase